MERRITLTADGSYTLFVPELDEHYHSINGAVQESKHVFIRYGLLPLIKTHKQINILEIGFGTGLNAFLSLVYSKQAAINYFAVEAYPIDLKQACNLYYPQHTSQLKEKDTFELLHTAPWNETTPITDGFILQKINARVEDFEFNNKVDLVYFDAFAPDVQPELWTEEIFKKMYTLMNPGGTLLTYCAKGQVKRNLKAAGFRVENLPGPPGKREMTRAWKLEND